MEWRVQGDGEFYDAGEESVVYFDAASGDTHLISDLAAQLINELSARPLSQEELTSRVFDAYEGEDQQLLGEVLASTLAQLADLGVLRRD